MHEGTIMSLDTNMDRNKRIMKDAVDRSLVEELERFYENDAAKITLEQKWKLSDRTVRIDVALSCGNDLMATFEIKSTGDPETIQKATEQFIQTFDGMAIPLCYIVVPNDKIASQFVFYDVTQQVIDDNPKAARWIEGYSHPRSFNKTVGFYRSRMQGDEPVVKKPVTNNRVFCAACIVFVILGIVLLLLDNFDLYDLSFEKLSVVLGITVIVFGGILLPKTKEINVGSVAWKLVEENMIDS